MVERRERRRILTDPDLKAVERLVHVDVVGVLVRRLYARIFRPRRIASRLVSCHKHRSHYVIEI